MRPMEGVHGPGPWRGSMDPVHGGGPWPRSIEGVHGPSPDKGSMDRGSMFCTFPLNVLFTCSIIKPIAILIYSISE